MNKKRILLVGDCFYPINSPRSFRTTQLAKEFSKQGHNVTVIVPKDKDVHPGIEKAYNIHIKDLGKINGKIGFNLNNSITNLFDRILRRGTDLFFEYPVVQWMFKVKKALKDESGYDLLISVAYPHPIHWGTALARSKGHQIAKTWVADCGDPFMGATTDTFSKPFYFKYIEKYWNKKCNFITVPFEGAVDGYYKEFHEKIKIIPQGFNFDDVKIDKNTYKPNSVPTFAYAGGFIPGARDPKYLIDYLLSKNVPFKFIVYTQTRNMIEPFLERAKGQIEIRDYIPRLELIMNLSKMDFILNLNNGVSTQLPSKLIDYYLTKRPVLSINSKDFDIKIIDEFLSGDYTNKYQYNNPDQYRIEHICDKFLKLIKE